MLHLTLKEMKVSILELLTQEILTGIPDGYVFSENYFTMIYSSFEKGYSRAIHGSTL